MTVKELFEYVKEFKEEFKDFKSNDFQCLEKKVDRLSVRIAWIMGGFTVVNGLVWVLVKVLG